MDTGSYKLPKLEIPESKKHGINNEFKYYLHELIIPLNTSRVSAGFKPLNSTAFLKMVERRYAKADTQTLKYIYDTAIKFNSFTHGITYLTKKV
jgi:hypothetical protein